MQADENREELDARKRLRGWLASSSLLDWTQGVECPRTQGNPCRSLFPSIFPLIISLNTAAHYFPQYLRFRTFSLGPPPAVPGGSEPCAVWASSSVSHCGEQREQIGEGLPGNSVEDVWSPNLGTFAHMCRKTYMHVCDDKRKHVRGENTIRRGTADAFVFTCRNF